MARSHDLGRRGEALAIAHLLRLGYTILERNFRFGHSEIDLIARRGRLVAFVEVKARSALGFGHPLEAVTAAKRLEIRRVAGSWIRSRGRPGDSYRYDAVTVIWPPRSPPLVEHWPDAWRG